MVHFRMQEIDMDWHCEMIMWLDCDTKLDGRKNIVTKFKTNISTGKNFSD